MTTAFIGIDPGKTGCAALWSQDNQVAFHDWQGVIAAKEMLLVWKHTFTILGTALEDIKFIHPKRRGVIAIRDLQRMIGQWEGMLLMGDIDYRMVTPAEWKRIIPPSKEEDPKQRAIDYVKKAVPGCEPWIRYKYHHNRAEALLMAYYIKEFKRLEGMRIQ